MSETTREMIPILFMYGFVLLLAPFIGAALWMAFSGDQPAAAEADAQVSAPVGAPKRVQAPAIRRSADTAA